MQRPSPLFLGLLLAVACGDTTDIQSPEPTKSPDTTHTEGEPTASQGQSTPTQTAIETTDMPTATPSAAPTTTPSAAPTATPSPQPGTPSAAPTPTVGPNTPTNAPITPTEGHTPTQGAATVTPEASPQPTPQPPTPMPTTPTQATATPTAEGDPTPGSSGLAILGHGTHRLDALILDVIADENDQLNRPRDLEFNKDHPNELWIVNQTEDAMVVIKNPDGENRQALYFSEPSSYHWLAQPSALAFGKPGFFATSHECDFCPPPPPEGSDPPPGDPVPPDDLSSTIGPTLWPSNTTDFNGGQSTHLDMVHDSPSSAGIAWEKDNIYWVHDGFNKTVTRYNFNEPHEPGGTDHSDVLVLRYGQDTVGYYPDVPSHMVYMNNASLLIIADTAHNRLVAIDATSGSQGDFIHSPDNLEKYWMDEVVHFTFVDGETLGMVRPSGLEWHDDHFFVSDNATGRIWALNFEGEVVDYLDTNLPDGALMGMTFDDAGRLYYVDALTHQVFRLSLAQ